MPRHQTLRAVVDWSWDLLDDPERVLLRRLSVFAGGATLETAEEVCGGPGLPRAAVLDLLARLVDRSLLEARSAPGTMRYRLTDTVRAYGLERLAAAGERDAIRRAHAECFRALAERADPELRGRDQLTWLARLNAEHDDLQAGLRWAVDSGEAELAQRLVIALHWYWTLRGHRVEGRDWVRTAAALGGDVPVAVRAAVLMLLALLATDEGNVTEGTAAFEASQELYRESGHRPHPLFWMVAPMLYLYGYGDEAMARASIAGVLADKEADPWMRAGMLLTLGMIDTTRGSLDEGEASIVAAADRCRQLGDRFGLALALTQLAQLAEDRRDYAGAEAALVEAMSELEPLGAREDVAWQWIRLGWIRGLAGDETGGRQIEEGIDRARDIGATDTVAMGLHIRATLARHHGDLPAARRGYEQALAVMEAARAGPSYRALPTIGQGFVAELEGDAERAEASHRRAVRILTEGSTVTPWDRVLLADAVEGLAGAAAAAGQGERAATLLGAATSLRDQLRPRAAQRMDSERVGATARGLLGAERHERARRRGEAMTFDEVLGVIA
jgi:tetratricopeptide (TPR) repeat protein